MCDCEHLPNLNHGHEFLELPEFLLRCLSMTVWGKSSFVPQAAPPTRPRCFTVRSHSLCSFIIIKTVFIIIPRLIIGCIPIVLALWTKANLHRLIFFQMYFIGHNCKVTLLHQRWMSISVPMAEGLMMLRLRRLAADRLLISHSVLSLPSRLLVPLLRTLRPLVSLFRSVQFPLRCGFLRDAEQRNKWGNSTTTCTMMLDCCC